MQHKPVNILSITVEELAQISSQMIGKKITPQMIRSDAGRGFPISADGTIDAVKYAAWLLRVTGNVRYN